MKKNTIFDLENLVKEQNKKLQENHDYKGASLNQLFSLFSLAGFTPNHIIDVGAHKGDWTREVMKYYPNVNCTLLEPQHELKCFAQDLLTKNNIKWYTLGAGCKDEMLSFTHVERKDSGSFIYSEKEANNGGYTQEKIQVNRLDTIIKNSDFGIPNIIKIDAEGLDLDVLKGLGDYLGKVEVIFVEVSLSCKFYKNTLEDVVSVMNKLDYRVFDVTDLNRPFRNKVLWLMELAFIKKDSKLDNFIWEK